MSKILHDARGVSPLAQTVDKLLQLADEMTVKYPAYEKDILLQTLRLIRKNVNESFGIFDEKTTKAHKSDKHAFFSGLIAEIEDLSDLGVKVDSSLSADMLEAIWKAIPNDLNMKVIVVRVIVQEDAIRGRQSSIQSAEQPSDEYPE